MRISPVTYEPKTQKTKFKNNSVAQTFVPQSNVISNIYYMPNLTPNFKGLRLETKVIQKVVGKEHHGLGIYTKDKQFIDYLKLNYEGLKKEALDITKATKEEITAYRFSLSLLESYAEGSEFGTQWVQRYNPFNRKNPLATSHSLNSIDIKEEVFNANLEILTNPKRGLSLDIPITDEKGRINLNCTVFDTETTGTNTNKDKIIQIATVPLKNGKIHEQGIFNKYINPEIPIPEEASLVNGITDATVKDAPTIEMVMDNFLGNSLNKQSGVIVAYNGVKFDVPLLNRAIREYNVFSAKDLKERAVYKVLDPYILIQRIHPFLGAKKKLSQQYHWLFCKPMDNAHDALADVKGTIDVLKYCLYALSEKRINKNIPLTLRQVLAFQNGAQNIPNLNFALSKTKNFNANVKFDESYKFDSLDVDNYFKNYKLNKQTLNGLVDVIGAENISRMEKSGIVDEPVGMTYKGHKLQAAETDKIPKTNKYQNASYVMKENFKKVLSFAKLEGFNGKSKEEIEELITENSKEYICKQSKNLWFKNVDPDDIKRGNDLPDDNITRRVMMEKMEDVKS